MMPPTNGESRPIVPERSPIKTIVLLGAGHTNAQMIERWAHRPLPKARLVCVSPFPVATYSGMLPGTLARQYRPAEMQIDLARLCRGAGVELIVAEVSRLDPTQRALHFADREPLPFDILSVGIGSVPDRSPIDESDAAAVVALKPMQTFLERLADRCGEVTQPERPVRVAVLGGGVAGIEIACCLPGWFGQQPHHITLLDAADRVAASLPPQVQHLVERHVARSGIATRLGQRVENVSGGVVTLESGDSDVFDIVLLATAARAPALLARLGLPTDERGFLPTRPTLQTTADLPVFAVGDSGTIVGRPVPKAGVYAVRQGPILWENSSRLLRGEPLVEYQPQGDFLKLLNTGDGRAIASWRGLAAHARWCWWWKDWIDRRFMRRFASESASR